MRGPGGWALFRKRYLKELARPECAAALDELYRLANRGKRLTLLFASKNEEYNNAVVLKELLEGMRKPPTGSGTWRSARGAGPSGEKECQQVKR